jgi:hypothetical protein
MSTENKLENNHHTFNNAVGVVNSSLHKVWDLFGDKQTVVISKKRKKPNLFGNYDAFLDKFQDKKTTDDCYTPNEVMSLIIDYVNQKYPLNGKKIIRPFFPGGDFESIDYTDDMVVIDNPPFSIITRICKYYLERNVKFFLFCPHLTAFSSDIDCTHIIASADITYENGATIKTAFVSNLFGNLKIIGDAELHQKLKELQAKNKAKFLKYEYPDHIITVSKIAYCVERGINIKLSKKGLKHYRIMDAQKKHGKALFGSGFIASDKVAAVVAAAKEEAAKVEANKKSRDIVWELSEREKEIIKSLEFD